MVPDEVAGCKQQHMRPPRCVAPRPCRRTARHRSHLLCGVRQPPTVCDSRDGMRQPRRHATPTTGCDADDPCESRSASHPTRADAQRVQPSHLLHGVRQPRRRATAATACESHTASHPAHADAQRVGPSHLLRGVRQPPKACDGPRRGAAAATTCDTDDRVRADDGAREPQCVAPNPRRRTARATVTPAVRGATATEGVRQPATGCDSPRRCARRRRCARAAVRRTPPAPTHSARDRHTCCAGCDTHQRGATAVTGCDGVRHRRSM